jgi:hypothetical protein
MTNMEIIKKKDNKTKETKESLELKSTETEVKNSLEEFKGRSE